MHSVLTEWADYLGAIGRSTATIKTRTHAVSAVANLAGVSPIELTRGHVLRALARYDSSWTKVTYWRSLMMFQRWCHEFDYAPKMDLLTGVPQPRSPKPTARPLEDETVAALLAVTLPFRPRAYVRLALFHALRVHEIAKIRAEDFNFTTRMQTVKGKGGYTELLPIQDEIMELAQMMPETGFWFPSHVHPDRSVRPESVSTSLKNALRRVGSTAGAHQLRDTAASQMQRRGGNIRITQTFLRHQVMQSSMKYTAVANADLLEAMNALSWRHSGGTVSQAA